MTRLPDSLRVAAAWLLYFSSILLLAEWIHASPEASTCGSVLFIEGRNHQFLRDLPKFSDSQASTFSGSDVWSAVAVLLGLSPPLTMTPSSAAKLDELLLPNPFHRPSSVLALTIPNLSADAIRDSLPEILGMNSYKLHPLTIEDSQLTLVSGNDRVQFLNVQNTHHSPELLDHELEELVQFLGGKYVKGLEEAHIVVPLLTGSELELSLSKTGDIDIVVELLKLVHGLKSTLDAQEMLTQVSQIRSQLLLGTIARSKASEAFLMLVSKAILALEAFHGGDFVAVILMPRNTAKESGEDILGIELVQPAARSLAEEPTIIQTYEVTILARRAITTFTALILFVAVLLGSYLLFNMPLTRDTLLYSTAKLD